jgi:dTDP-4-dehydrorhamnose 3,5-epimerase
MSERFHVLETPLGGLALIERKPIGDQRGSLERLFCSDELGPLLSGKPILQINRTVTVKSGAVRGLHFQHPPFAEIKLVSCIRGEVFDVAVDLRRDSPTFLQWHAAILSADNHLTFAIPEGFAHGFQAMRPDCEMLYMHTAPYRPAHEGGLNATDLRLAVRWPQVISERSERDASFPMLTSDFVGLSL